MSTIAIKTIDTFCDIPYGGNPAGVVLDAERLTTEQMKTIARAVNLPETAFVLPGTLPDVPLKVHWFTPQGEIKTSGHAMIAVFHALAEENRLGIPASGDHHLAFEDASGVHEADLKTSDGLRRIFVGMNVPVVNLGLPFSPEFK